MASKVIGRGPGACPYQRQWLGPCSWITRKSSRRTSQSHPVLCHTGSWTMSSVA